MSRLKRFLYFLMINVIVSAGTMYAVLKYWEKTNPALLNLPASQTAAPITMDLLPTLTYTMEPTLEPTIALETYAAKLGDTLGSIALDYDVTVEELLSLNGLSDPNSLGVGQIIVIPMQITKEEMEGSSDGLPAAILPTVTLDALIGNARVEIIAVLGAGDLATERVLFRRSGDGELALTNWVLSDENGNSFTIPQVILYKDGAVNIHTSNGLNTVVDLFWGSDSSMWEAGEIVTLFDTLGNVQATYQIP